MIGSFGTTSLINPSQGTRIRSTWHTSATLTLESSIWFVMWLEDMDNFFSTCSRLECDCCKMHLLNKQAVCLQGCRIEILVCFLHTEFLRCSRKGARLAFCQAAILLRFFKAKWIISAQKRKDTTTCETVVNTPYGVVVLSLYWPLNGYHTGHTA